MIKWFLSLFLLVFSLYGCSLLSESSSHPYSGYYKSNWTSDGNIIASKQVGNKIIGRNSDPEYEGTSYIVEINLNSISSENIILNTNISSTYQDTLEWDSLHNLSYALSNSNKYVVYYSYDLNYLTTPTFIKFYKNESLLKSVSTAYPEGNSTEYRSNLSFNSAKDKLLFSLNKERFVIFSTDGTLLKEKNIGGRAIWKDDNSILFYHQQENKLAEYKINDDSIQLFSHQFIPEYYKLAQNTVLTIESGVFKLYDLTTDSVTTSKNLNYDYQVYNDHKFSPDGTKLLLSKLDSFSQHNTDSFGIYVYNLENDQLTKVRD